jgi:AcrR family transcriptional regulator
LLLFIAIPPHGERRVQNTRTIVSEHNVHIPKERIETRRRRSSVIEQAASDCSEREGPVKAKPVDRRIQRTQQLLRTALMSLIQEKGFESLSVQDIIDRANVGRATFYAHFDSKEDLLASGIDGLRASLRERQHRALSATNGDDRLFAFSHELFAHANEHRAVFRAMTGKRSGAVIQQLLHKMLVDLVRDEVKLMFPSSAVRETPLEAISQFIGGGLFGLLIWWGSGMMRMPVDEVDAVFRRLAIPATRAAIG